MKLAFGSKAKTLFTVALTIGLSAQALAQEAQVQTQSQSQTQSQATATAGEAKAEAKVEEKAPEAAAPKAEEVKAEAKVEAAPAAPVAPVAPVAPAAPVAPVVAAETKAETKDAPLAVVTQVFRDDEKAVAELTGQRVLAKGARVIVTAQSGEACETRVIDRNGNKVMIDLADCLSTADHVKAGALVSLPEFGNATAVAIEMPSEPVVQSVASAQASRKTRIRDRQVKLGLGVYSTSGDRMTFANAESSTALGSTESEITYHTDTAPGLLIEATVNERQSWGFQIGMSFDARRRINSADVTSGVTTQSTATAGDPDIAIAHFYANALYRWDVVYIPFGLNYSFVSMRNPPPAMLGIRGGMSAQLGIGFALGEQVAIELVSRGTTLHGSETTTAGRTTDLGTGTMPSGHAGLKVMF